MFKNANTALLASLFAGALLTPSAPAQVGQGLVDPNVATAAQLTGLPGLPEPLVATLLQERPFGDAAEFDAFLSGQGLDEAARDSLYARAFVHLDLQTASQDDFRLIPGVGKRIAHELQEYRPWKSWTQFDKEIGKYVDDEEVARLKQYLFIPLDLNTASEADFMTIPGVGKRMAHEFAEYRPWKSKAQFEREIGKYVKEPEVARLWRYMVIG